MKNQLDRVFRRGRIYPFLFVFIVLWMGVGSLFATAEWTVLVYMAADNGLSEYAKQDINDMESITIPSNTNVIVQADFPETSNPAGAYRYKINHGTTNNIESQILANLGEINSGDYNSLKSFISWGFANYPAQHKALVIWSHGDSWYKGNDTKWICPDNSVEGIMSVADGDLRSALVNCLPLDILLFDACSMQTLEVLGEVADKAKYVIGSEDIVPVYGFPYQDMLPVWRGDADSLAAKIPYLYVNSYTPYGSQNPNGYIVKAGCSALETTYYENIPSLLATFVGNEMTAADTIFAARQLCYNFNTNEAEIDFVEFLNKVSTLLPADDVSYFVQPLLSTTNLLIREKAAINYDAEAGNFTIWFPQDKAFFNPWWQHYAQLPMPSLWLGLLCAALGADSDIPPKPILTNTALIFNDLHIYWETTPTPEYLSFHMIFDYDDALLVDRFIDSYGYVYSQSNGQHAGTIHDIKGNGWLYIFTKDIDGNQSGRDSVYVNWAAPKPELIVYPNPCRNSRAIYFEWWSDLDATARIIDEQEIKIYDIKGRLVETIKPRIFKQGSRKVDLSRLHSGIYIARVKIGKQELTTKFTLLSDD